MKKSVDGIAGLLCFLLATGALGCSNGTSKADDSSPDPIAPAGGSAMGGAGAGGAAAGSATGGSAAAGSTAGGTTTSDDVSDPLAALPTGAAQLQALCARNNGDRVAQAFCGSSAPTIASLRDLQMLVGLDLTDPHSAQGALVTQSTSLVKRLTTPINPRAIIVPYTKELTKLFPAGDKQPNATWVTLAFVRGEQFVELASKDPTANDAIRFYLFNFKQECNDTAGGCTPGDLFTPESEKHFTSYSLYEDVDLANTSLDCTQCHQQQGPGTPKLLINQSYGYDWGHWAINAGQVSESTILCAQFNEMHASDEDYAGIPNAYLGCTRGGADYAMNESQGPGVGGPQAVDEFFYNNGSAPAMGAYGTVFEGKTIFTEVAPYGSQQPAVNVPIGVSPFWQTLVDSYVPGQSLEIPYHDLLNTDPQKLSAVIAAYKAVVAGTTPKNELPDMSDMLVKEGLADMFITPQPDLTGRQMLTAMCQQCHNSHVDQSLSRAHFNVEKLDEMSRPEKDEAVRRLQLPDTSARHMPPRRFHELSAPQIELVTQELMR